MGNSMREVFLPDCFFHNFSKVFPNRRPAVLERFTSSLFSSSKLLAPDSDLFIAVMTCLRLWYTTWFTAWLTKIDILSVSWVRSLMFILLPSLASIVLLSRDDSGPMMSLTFFSIWDSCLSLIRSNLSPFAMGSFGFLLAVASISILINSSSLRTGVIFVGTGWSPRMPFSRSASLKCSSELSIWARSSWRAFSFLWNENRLTLSFLLCFFVVCLSGEVSGSDSELDDPELLELELVLCFLFRFCLGDLLGFLVFFAFFVDFPTCFLRLSFEALSLSNLFSSSSESDS